MRYKCNEETWYTIGTKAPLPPSSLLPPGMHLGYVGVALYRQGQKKAGIKKIKRHLAYGKKFWFGEKSRPKFFKVLVSLNLQKNTVKGYQEAWKYWNASCEAETDNYLSYVEKRREGRLQSSTLREPTLCAVCVCTLRRGEENSFNPLCLCVLCDAVCRVCEWVRCVLCACACAVLCEWCYVLKRKSTYTIYAWCYVLIQVWLSFFPQVPV